MGSVIREINSLVKAAMATDWRMHGGNESGGVKAPQGDRHLSDESIRERMSLEFPNVSLPAMTSNVDYNRRALREYLRQRDLAVRALSGSPRRNDGYKVGITPGSRPASGPLHDSNVYSDNGRFWNVTLPGGRTTTVYLRDSVGAPNLAVPSEGWNADEANDIAAAIYSSNLSRPDGTVAGAPMQQAIKEIVSHDEMNKVRGASLPAKIGLLSVSPFSSIL